MSQFYSFHDSAIKFATQHIFVCPLEQVICPCAPALLTNFNKQPLRKAAEQPNTHQLETELLGEDQDWHKFSSSTSGLALKSITACGVRAEPQTHMIPPEQPWEQWTPSCSNGSSTEQQVPPWLLHEGIQDSETQQKSRTQTIRHSGGLWKIWGFLPGRTWYTWPLLGDGCPHHSSLAFPLPPGSWSLALLLRAQALKSKPHSTQDSSIPGDSLAPSLSPLPTGTQGQQQKSNQAAKIFCEKHDLFGQ